VSDVSARILARMSVSWNAGLKRACWLEERVVKFLKYAFLFIHSFTLNSFIGIACAAYSPQFDSKTAHRMDDYVSSFQAVMVDAVRCNEMR